MGAGYSRSTKDNWRNVVDNRVPDDLLVRVVCRNGAFIDNLDDIPWRGFYRVLASVIAQQLKRRGREWIGLYGGGQFLGLNPLVRRLLVHQLAEQLLHEGLDVGRG